jgi:ribosomal protein L7/L12
MDKSRSVKELYSYISFMNNKNSQLINVNENLVKEKDALQEENKLLRDENNMLFDKSSLYKLGRPDIDEKSLTTIFEDNKSFLLNIIQSNSSMNATINNMFTLLTKMTSNANTQEVQPSSFDIKIKKFDNKTDVIKVMEVIRKDLDVNEIDDLIEENRNSIFVKNVSIKTDAIKIKKQLEDVMAVVEIIPKY